jgi:DNA-directed RNA polymerase specialized sigma subunit, sigma24 homolog
MPEKSQNILNDSDILDIFYQEDRKEYAFTLLVHKYNERLYWHIRKMVDSHEDTNDLLQMVFIKIWKYLPDFRRDSQLYTWIYRIATNETLTFLKKKI